MYIFNEDKQQKKNETIVEGQRLLGPNIMESI